ncbi:MULTISPECIES: carbohydrate kinase family protein [unclassified Streptomyces]|uniref:carbohydrate kinase family protein n=1 Tax=unclassified Streptomyces TaxID=2593676 RepID=UPI0035DF649E
MRIAVTGSIATDHLMTFPGRITDQLLADRLDHVSLSFLVDSLEVRDGGVAANIAYGLAALGHRPLLVGAVGADFDPYGWRLADQGVDISAVHISPTRHTARFLCTTDQAGNQIASFYAGAMSEAAAIDLAAVVRDHAGLDLVHVGADEPAAMLRHTRACRALGLRFIADPSQQLARLDGEQIRELVAGADHLFTNEYERGLLIAKSGWTRTDVLRQVGTWVTTLGEKGSRIERAGDPVLDVPAVAGATVTDPTGVGDAFRAGYLASFTKGEHAVACAQAGSALAALALASVGTQTYTASPALLRDLLTTSYEAAGRPATGLLPEDARP